MAEGIFPLFAHCGSVMENLVRILSRLRYSSYEWMLTCAIPISTVTYHTYQNQKVFRGKCNGASWRMRNAKTLDPTDYAEGYKGYKSPPAKFRKQMNAGAASDASVNPDAGPECKKWVIAYSMYGSDAATISARYTDGAFANTELIKAVFPGWVMRVYHDDTVPGDILKELQQLGVELRDMTRSGLSNKMTWRFTAASDASVDRFLIRDLDSRLSIREKVAVDEWILSGKKFHVMRDHPSHSLFAMSGGMWGGTGDAAPQMKDLIASGRVDGKYVADMNFLTTAVWPLALKSMLQHDAFSCNHDGFSPNGDATSWPMPRVATEHIGSVFMTKYSPVRDTDAAALLEKLPSQPTQCRDRGPPEILPVQSTARCKSALPPPPPP